MQWSPGVPMGTALEGGEGRRWSRRGEGPHVSYSREVWFQPTIANLQEKFIWESLTSAMVAAYQSHRGFIIQPVFHEL